MASIRDLKNDLNNTYGEVIDAVLVHQQVNNKEDKAESEQLIDDIIDSFDHFISEINRKDVDHRAKHLKAVKSDIEEKLNAFIERLNKL